MRHSEVRCALLMVLATQAVFFSPRAEEISLDVQKAAVITFPSTDKRTYQLFGAENAEGPWRSLQDGITGTGGAVTIFYKSESDQKLFFKVEGRDGSPAQQALLSAARLDLRAQNFTGIQLPGQDLKLFNLADATFDNANLAGAILSGATAENTSFKGADLSGAFIYDAGNLNGAHFNGANLQGQRFGSSPMQNADFRSAKLEGASFSLSGLRGANFAGQNLSNVVFRYCDLSASDFSGASLAGAELSRSTLWSAKVDGANLRNVNLEGTFMADVPFTRRDLQGSLLRGVVVQSLWNGINAAGVDASLLSGNGANMAGGNFAGGNLEGATLVGATLVGAILTNTKLQGASLGNANLRNAELTGADFSFADLTGAHFTGAIGFDPEQPGIDFGTGTTLPSGLTRRGRNPGVGLAPRSVPEKLRLEIRDLGFSITRDLTFIFPATYTEPGTAGGRFKYSAQDMSAVLTLTTSVNVIESTLLFTEPGKGKLFQNSNRSGVIGVYMTGTFTVLP